MTDSRTLLRHTLATLAYRGGKSIRNAPASFAEFHASDTSRTPVRILAHIGDLLDWGLSIAEGNVRWNDSKPLPWDDECQRFFASLKKLDDYLASENELHASGEKLFQGPIADALTHVGQIAMLRRIAGCPIQGESYYAAEILVGRVGADQAAPRKVFD